MILKPITTKEFDNYLVKSVKKYEKELLTAGCESPEAAKQEAEATIKRLLPKGQDTEGHYFYHAYENDNLVGFIWLAFREKDTVFIYDFYIVENMRRKGYGKQVLHATEAKAKEKGATAIRLHVFGHNKAARALYESLDYYPTSIQMRKDL